MPQNHLLWQLIHDEDGMTSVEYTLLLAFIGAAVAIAIMALATATGQIMDDTTTQISD